MRPEEKFVQDALLTHLGDQSISRALEGDDPPDFYLERRDDSILIAVEVTTLTQFAVNANGSPGSRNSHDSFGLQVIDELNADFESQIPDTMSLVVVLQLPTSNGRSFKRKLKACIAEVVQNLTPGFRIDRVIEAAKVSVTVVAEGHANERIRGLIANRNSSADILLNASHTLEDRIRTKDEICRALLHRGPVWLALLNGYWLADADTYVMAMKQLEIEHCFERIFVVSDNGQVTEL